MKETKLFSFDIIEKVLRRDKLDFNLEPSQIYHYLNHFIVFRIRSLSSKERKYYDRNESYEVVFGETDPEESY